MNIDFDAHTGLQRTRQREARGDWAMRQFVDDMLVLMGAHPAHEQIDALMRERGVPVHVRQRVLAGG